MNIDSNISAVMKQIDYLELELSRLKRVLLHNLPSAEKRKRGKTSLFGSVRGSDVTDAMIEESKQILFRKLGDI